MFRLEFKFYYIQTTVTVVFTKDQDDQTSSPILSNIHILTKSEVAPDKREVSPG